MVERAAARRGEFGWAGLALVCGLALSGGCATRGGVVEVSESNVNDSSYVHEVEELHAFFEAWFNGLTANDAETFERFAGAMAPGFVLLSPNGELFDREGILAVVRDNHGADGGSPTRIWVEEPVVHLLAEGEVAVCYEEWHEREGIRTGRSSRALMRPNPAAPNGIEWLRVDEVWIN